MHYALANIEGLMIVAQIVGSHLSERVG